MTYDMNSSKRSDSSHTHAPKQEKSPLSSAAAIMRNPNATPEERRKAAAMLGRQGGLHSHDNDPGKRTALQSSERVLENL